MGVGEIYSHLLESTSHFKVIGEARLELVFLTFVEFIYEDGFSSALFLCFNVACPLYLCLLFRTGKKSCMFDISWAVTSSQGNYWAP